ncbi:unnamed protein product [Auanema sp. JU1783]|nr:unnamed protein product [Auanema sp. JU1783]
MLFKNFRTILCGEDHNKVLHSSSYNESYPVFENCFHHVDLSWIPTIFLFLSIPLVLYDLHKSRREPIGFYSPATLRIFLAIAILIVQIITFVRNTAEVLHNNESAVYLIGDGFQFFGVLLTLVLTIACKNRGVVSSGTICLFWTMMIICGLPEFISVLIADDEEPSVSSFRGLTHAIFYLLCVAEFILSIVADPVREKWRGSNAKPCPEADASFFSRITFTYFNSLAAEGNRVPLERRHLWDLSDEDSAKFVYDDFHVHFDKEMTKLRQFRESHPDVELTGDTKPSIFKPIFQTYKLSFIGGGFMKLCFDTVQFAAPLLLSQLIRFISHPSLPRWVGFSIALALFLLTTAQSLFLHQYFHIMFKCGMNIRSALTQAVYRKMLRLSSSSRRTMSTGQFLNLVNVDIQRLQDMTSFIMLFWSAPLQIIIAIFFLVQLMGPCIFAGIAILIALLPFNSYISVQMRNIQMDQMKKKDQRSKVMTEMIGGIKTIKFNAWESFAEKLISAIRVKEIGILQKLALMSASTTLSWACAPFLVAVLSFAIFVFIDPVNNVLTPQITFVALSLFNIIRFPLAVFAMIISQAAQCLVSNQRLRDLFSMEEIDEKAVDHNEGGDLAVKLENATFSWEKGADNHLNDCTLNIKKGSLVAIVGRVGSGKSSLLNAILGEMSRVSGSANVDGTISYVPQDPWIMHLSARENISLDSSISDEFYERIVKCCALEPDFNNMPQGDSTIIGDRGISLSGGQKQRISLARAIYARNDIYLIDDILASVDAHVANHVFKQVLSKKHGLLNGKTRMFITNRIQNLSGCDQIIYMKDGQVSEVGSYSQLMENNGAFKEMVEEFLTQERRSKIKSASEQFQDTDLVMLEETNSESEASDSLSLASTQDSKSDIVENESTALLPATNQTQKKVFSQDAQEQVKTGQVSFSIHLAYLRAIGIPLVSAFVVVYVFSSILGVGSNLWLAKWSDEAKEIALKSNGTYGEIFHQLGVYTLLGLGQAFSVCGASALMALGMVRAGRVLHDDMLHKVLRVPMSFFDTTATGKIMTRFSKDIEVVDTRLPAALLTFTGAIVQAIIILFVPIYTTPLIAFAILPILLFYYMILRYYVSTSRQLKRLESATRAPINSLLQDTVLGGSSIRAFREEERFEQECAKRVDDNIVTYYPTIVANRWLAVRLELVGNLIVLFSSVFSVLYRGSDGVTAGLVGLSIAYSLNITQTLNWAVRMTSELETNVVAVERIQEYTKLEVEGSKDTDHTPVPTGWPRNGEIVIKNLTVRYRPTTECVLKGLCMNINANEKIGIVGRTGSGKSTLALSLFRIVEAEKGTIEVDGENIADFSLESLRSKMTIVPQDPYLFSGTLRMNLDPTGTAAEHEVWHALQASYLDNFIASLPGGLAYIVSENGENISVGQRQLICLARAILRKSKILVLDEAAAVVDVETDSLIQKTIKKEFKDCTVLTIAHRISSVTDYDRIAVMSDGNVVEMDSPKVLLADPNSLFYGLAKAAEISSSQKNESKPKN